jgi:hypothetical protein
VTLREEKSKSPNDSEDAGVTASMMQEKDKDMPWTEDG